MATRVLNAEFPTDHLPLLRWLIFTGVCVFAFVLAWYYGLVRMMVNGDKHTIHFVLGCVLRGPAAPLRGPNQLGSYGGDALMKLGLLGTIIGFIMMLAPIAGLDAADKVSVKTSMGLMSDGRAGDRCTT